MRVYEFGPFESPYYLAHVGPKIAPKDAPGDGNWHPAWCCAKGHRTVRAAAEHAARLAAEEWSKAA